MPASPSDIPASRAIAAVTAAALLALASPAGAQRAQLESEALLQARERLGGDFIERETSRFVILSDAGRRETQRYAEYLERTHHQFNRFCRRLGLEPQPLRHKLVVVLFERREHYRSFAKAHDLVGAPDLAGYYSPANDRVVLYDVKTNPSVAEARLKLADMRSEIADLNDRAREASRDGRVGEARSLRTAIGQYEDHLRSQSRRIDDFQVQTSIATTVHEAVHQLLFHTGIQSRHVEYPLWLSEGLATAFETDVPGQAFGPDHEYSPRRDEFQQLLATDQLIPLSELVRVGRPSELQPQQVHALYHQGYSLVTWLVRARPRELARLLGLIASEPTGRPTADRQLELFEQALGDVNELEQAWLRFEHSR